MTSVHIHDIDAKLDDLIRQIKADYLAWEQYFWPGVTAIEPLDESDRVRATLEWGEPPVEVVAAVNRQREPLAAARTRIRHELKNFINSDDGVLLLRVDAGVGKSTALIGLSQMAATQGHNVLYLMPYHRYWDDIMNNAATIPDLWYHWQSINGQTPDGDNLCRYHDAAATWTKKGYPLMELCKRVCKSDSHIKRCPYRLQRFTPQRIKAGVHPHLVTGIAVDDISLCIVDELPIGQFLPERIIAPNNIQVSPDYSHSDTRMMLDILSGLARGARHTDRISGKLLLDAIGGFLERIYASINLDKKDSLQAIPDLVDPTGVNNVQEWYLLDMLRLLVPEYHAWKNGLAEWLTRVYISGDGLHLLQRRLPWTGLPKKLIILDATGRPDIYEKLLGRPVKVVDITTERTGKIYQITGRLNNITSVLDRKMGTLRKNGNEAADLIRLIHSSKPLGNGKFGQYSSMGIVTFKGIVEQIADQLTDLPVKAVWYQGSRGTNVLEGVDCLVCLGSPAIPDTQIIDTYAQLNYEPGKPQESAIKPFKHRVLANGAIRPIRHAGKVAYRYVRPDGLSPQRYLSGFWDYPELQSVADLFTSDELVQAIGRARLPFKDCHVWLLTSAYTPLVVDGVFDDPGECLNIPVGIDWKHWLSIRQVLESQKTIRADDLADATGVSRAWARHWVRMIASWDSDRFKLSLFGHGRGRKETILVVNEVAISEKGDRINYE